MDFTDILQKNSSHTLFISDLHLDGSHPEITRLFLTFLSSCNSSIKAIYILGDLFEVWIGDDDESAFNHTIINALKAVTNRGIPIYYLHGNRDFLLGKKFLQNSGCKLLADETVVDIYGTKVLLMHGDTLCTRDTAYLNVRKKLRNYWVQKFILVLPLFIRIQIAEKMREKSKQYTTTTPLEIMDVTQQEVEHVMQKNNVRNLIHGHTHKPAFHEFTLNNTQAMRIVLGAWHEHGSILVWDSSGYKQLISI